MLSLCSTFHRRCSILHRIWKVTALLSQLAYTAKINPFVLLSVSVGTGRRAVRWCINTAAALLAFLFQDQHTLIFVAFFYVHIGSNTAV